MNAIIHLIDFALARGCVISVHDGGEPHEWPVKNSTDKKEILEAVESVSEATIKIKSHKQTMGIAFVSNANDMLDNEKVIDHSDNLFMNQWSDQYETEYPGE